MSQEARGGLWDEELVSEFLTMLKKQRRVAKATSPPCNSDSGLFLESP